MSSQIDFSVRILLVVSILYSQYGISLGTSFEEDLTLTLPQKVQLDKFREIVESRLPHKYMKEDIYLIRWLRARNFDLKQAERMLMNNLKWREENKIDTILQEDWSYFNRKYPYSLKGRDKYGRSMLYFNIGNMDVRSDVLAGQTQLINRYIDKGLEESCNLVRELGEKYKNISQGNFILDVGGFNLVQHACLGCIPIFLRLIVQYENHYPGCTDTLTVINVPAIAEYVIEPAKSLLHPQTKKILKIFGTNKKQWMQEILKYFTWDQLPPEIGGSLEYRNEEDDYNFGF